MNRSARKRRDGKKDISLGGEARRGILKMPRTAGQGGRKSERGQMGSPCCIGNGEEQRARKRECM